MGAGGRRTGRLARLTTGFVMAASPLALLPLVDRYSTRSLFEHYERENRAAAAAARVLYEANGWPGLDERSTCCGPDGAWITCDDKPVDEERDAANAAGATVTRLSDEANSSAGTTVEGIERALPSHPWR